MVTLILLLIHVRVWRVGQTWLTVKQSRRQGLARLGTERFQHLELAEDVATAGRELAHCLAVGFLREAEPPAELFHIAGEPYEFVI